MRVFRCLVLLILAGSTLAQAQHLVFTMRTFPTCPVVISSIQSSPEYGFHSLHLLDDSNKAIVSMRLSVAIALNPDEEVVDGGTVYVSLKPGDRKNVDVFLGEMRSLTEKAKQLHLTVARAIVYVETVDFADGTRWDPRVQVPDVPARPLQK